MIYLYKCFHCGYEFERDHAVDNRYLPLSEPCPWCKASRSVQKLVTSVPFKVKGANAKNGYSTNVGDIEKRLGREITMEDLDD
jgi:predicted nucleic acid-binding Zn ribbon protein